MTARAWEAFSRLQDHVIAIRDHIGAAERCLWMMSWADETIPEKNYRALATKLRDLADRCERQAEQARQRAA